MNIRFSPPDITRDEIDEVTDTLLSGWITTGPKTKLLEKKFAQYTGTNKFACFNSATAAMELVLRLFGVCEGDEVITSAYTYTASAAVICHVGAKPVIVDTEPGSFEISASAVERALTEKTKAVIPIDIGGVLCDYDRLRGVLEANKNRFMPKNDMQAAIGRVLILSDSAHSFGSTRNGIMSGLHADFSCFSFHAIKNLAMGEGGAVTWKPVQGVSDEEIYRSFMLLSLHGQTKDALSKTEAGGWEYDIELPGYKCNLTDIMASLGIAQLRRYQGFLERRGELVKIYESILSGVWTLKHEGGDFVSNKHLFIARMTDKGEDFRNDVIMRLGERGIPANVHFKPLPLLTAYKNMGYGIKDFPNAYNMYKNAVSLPLHTLLTDDEARYIAENFAEVINK